MSERPWECSLVCICWNEVRRSSGSQVERSSLNGIDIILGDFRNKIIAAWSVPLLPTTWNCPFLRPNGPCLSYVTQTYLLDWRNSPCRLPFVAIFRSLITRCLSRIGDIKKKNQDVTRVAIATRWWPEESSSMAGGSLERCIGRFR